MPNDTQQLKERVAFLEAIVRQFFLSDRYRVVRDFEFDPSRGSKIGTTAGQKIGFYGAMPVTQQLKASHNNWAATSDVVSALVNLGLFDQA